MTTDEAREIAAAFDENTNPSEEEIFIFTEAMNSGEFVTVKKAGF